MPNGRTRHCTRKRGTRAPPRSLSIHFSFSPVNSWRHRTFRISGRSSTMSVLSIRSRRMLVGRRACSSIACFLSLLLLVGSPQNYHDQLLSFSGRYLNTMTNDLLRMALALRFYSPTVQMMRKMAHDTGMTRQCSTFVDVHGACTCNVDEIDGLIASANER